MKKKKAYAKIPNTIRAKIASLVKAKYVAHVLTRGRKIEREGEVEGEGGGGGTSPLRRGYLHTARRIKLC